MQSRITNTRSQAVAQSGFCQTPFARFNILMATASVVFLLAGVTKVDANPVVTDSTISWPDDGWYQVQSLPDYTSICEGGQSCQVDAGDYVVINHSTGERFENISVAVSNSTADAGGVSVNGNTLSWADDGWYQVQALPDYNSVCEGGRSCEVATGEYVVINHSSGERFEGIRVGSGGMQTGGSQTGGSQIDIDAVLDVSVIDNTIVWPDDGWYQVQNGSDYSTVCEGGRSCEVAVGSYTVINHSTGERFENIVVGSGGASGGEGTDPAARLTGFANRQAFERTLKDAMLAYYVDTGRYTGVTSTAGLAGGDNQPLADANSPAAPTAPSASTSESGAADFTTTNLQEQGVDEADRIKTDGRFLYVLGESASGAVPFPIGPIDDLPVISLPVIRPAIEQPVDQASSLVADSLPPYQPQSIALRVLEMDSDSADAAVLSETMVQIGGHSVDGMYLHGANDGDDGNDALLLTSSSLGGVYWDYWYSPVAWGNTTSSVHRLDVSNRTSPALTTSVTFDGQIVSSRVVGDHLFVASRYFPQPSSLDVNDPAVPFVDSIEALDIASVMPNFYQGDSADTATASTPLSSADNCFAAESRDDSNRLPNIITLVAINLNDLTLSDSVCYLGDVDTLYASPNSAYLSTTHYNAHVTSSGSRRAITQTDIHQFDFAAGQLNYRGSGRVDGYVSGSNSQRPFRFSEANGYLRVVTENDQAPLSTGSTNPQDSPVFINVLRPGDSQVLELVATLPNQAQPSHIGKVGERLYASRFLGDKAYLVTFRQVDPLYVIDFSNPQNPIVAGELVIEGYSDYLHPVGEHHLLGLGRGAIPDPFGGDGGRGAFATGIKISLFDVADPSNPTEVQALEIGRRGSSAEALFDHHGVTYLPGTDGAPGRLAFGISVNDIAPQQVFGPVTFYNWRDTGLHTFEIRTGDNPGIEPVGRLIVEAANPTNPWGPRFGADRSVLVNDAVFYVHGDQVYGAQWRAVESFNGPR